MRALRWSAVILDRLPQVLDAERKLRVVRLQLTGLGEVDKAVDTRVDEAFQPFTRRITVRATGMLAGERLITNAEINEALEGDTR